MSSASDIDLRQQRGIEPTLTPLVEHVLETYLPRKLANFCGRTTVDAQCIVRVPSQHDGDEGKIKGMWEQFVEPKGRKRHGMGILDLRVSCLLEVFIFQLKPFFLIQFTIFRFV